MEVEVKFIDAFTIEGRSPSGNPAAVVVLRDGYVEDARMQALANKIGVSETAFLVPDPIDNQSFQLRWFTPAKEVELCGHATLASAAAVGPCDVVNFNTVMKPQKLSVLHRDGLLWLDFPLLPVNIPELPPPVLLESLGIIAEQCLFYGKSTYDDVLEVESLCLLADLKPDFRALAKVPLRRGLIVTSLVRGEDDRKDYNLPDSWNVDFASRFFAPAVGIDEDPVTGSAHCALAAFWQAKTPGKNRFLAVQLSDLRGVVRIEVIGSSVLLGGQSEFKKEEKMLL